MKVFLSVAAAALILTASGSNTPQDALDVDDFQDIDFSISRQGTGAPDPNNWNIDGTYASVLKFGNDPACPSEIKIKNSVPLSDTLVTVPFNQIEEDGVACEGQGGLLSYTMRHVNAEKGYKEANRDHGLEDLLGENNNAQTQLFSKKNFQESRISFDRFADPNNPVRKCGGKTYGKSSFYFNIKGGVGNSLQIGSSASQLKTFDFEVGQNGLFMMSIDAAKKKHFCVLQTNGQPIMQYPALFSAPVSTATVPGTAPLSIRTTTSTTTVAKEAETTAKKTENAAVPSTTQTTASSTAVAADSGDSATSPAAAASPAEGENDREGVASDAVCFPASATVQLEDGRVKSMEELAVGDRVLSSVGLYSEVFGFTHKLPRTESFREFMGLAIGENEFLLRATASHYIYLNGNLRAAGEARIGDFVNLGDGRMAAITSVKKEMGYGLYNPQTIHGDIVVNGVVSSTYTQAFDARAAHAGLSVARAAFNWFGAFTTAFESGSDLTAFLPHAAVRVA